MISCIIDGIIRSIHIIIICDIGVISSIVGISSIIRIISACIIGTISNIRTIGSIRVINCTYFTQASNVRTSFRYLTISTHIVLIKVIEG